MIVVSDTSCITNLMAVGHEHLLELLFGELYVPPAVMAELKVSHPTLPPFIQLRVPDQSQLLERLSTELDPGEAEAICLAKSMPAGKLLIDESKGRAAARREGVPVMGLLGVLLLAKHRDHIPRIEPLINRLRDEAFFRLAPRLVRDFLEQAGEG